VIVLSPEFLVKNISQSTPFPRANNSIFIEIEVSTDQRGSDSSVILLTGLIGSDTSSNLRLRLVAANAASQRDFMETASWDKDIGQLKLSVRPTATMRFGVRYVFVIFLTNPDAAMTAKDVTISIESGTVPIAPSFMSRPLDRERQVLFVSAPKFNLALAAQRHPFPGSLNGIQVRFITNIDLVGPKTSDGAGDCILISGLLNTRRESKARSPMVCRCKLLTIHASSCSVTSSVILQTAISVHKYRYVDLWDIEDCHFVRIGEYHRTKTTNIVVSP